MELRDFIKESLRQIVEGVALAQQDAAVGGHINAKQDYRTEMGGNVLHSGDLGIFTRVDFDVLVSAETSGKGSVNLKVFGVGADAGADRKTGASNRLAFSVPVRLPEGDVELAAKIEERRKIEAKERTGKFYELGERLNR